MSNELTTPDRMEKVMSQKAKCLVDVKQRTSWNLLSLYPLLLDDNVEIIEKAIIKSRNSKHDNKVFIRACPITPRHGVLESASTHLITEGVDIYNRIRNTMLDKDGDGYEPEGCMIVQPFIEATSSAVLAPNNYIAIGTGHDGITAAGQVRGFNITLPISKEYEESWNTYQFIHYLAEETIDKVELEFIHKDNRAYLTQVRRCPVHPPLGRARIMIVGQEDMGSCAGVIAHLAEEMVVSEVFVVNDLTDVATMEKIVHGDMPEGYIIVEPNGSTLSHAACHARDNNVSYSSRMVEVGDTIVSSNDYDYMNYKAYFMRGIEYARRHWKPEWGWMSTFFHQFVLDPYCDEKDCAFFAGCYVGWMANAGLAACLGETRHSRSSMSNYKPTIGVVLSKLTDNGWTSPSNSRQFYYTYLDNQVLPYEDIVAGYEWTSEIFSHSWGSSYGGQAWANCADTLCNLTKAIMTGDAKKIVSAANKAENINHNGGWLFNKFVNKHAMDFGTKGFSAHGEHTNDMFKLFETVHGMHDSLSKNDYRLPKNDAIKPTWSSIINSKEIPQKVHNLEPSNWATEKNNDYPCPNGECIWCTATPQHIYSSLDGYHEAWLVDDKLYYSPEAGESVKMTWDEAIELMKETGWIDNKLAVYIYTNIDISSNGLTQYWNTAIKNLIPTIQIVDWGGWCGFGTIENAGKSGCPVAQELYDDYENSDGHWPSHYEGVLPEHIDLKTLAGIEIKTLSSKMKEE